MTSYWQLQPIFDSYLLVGLLAAGSLALLWIHPSFGSLSPGRRRMLTILRALLVLVLLALMLRPARVTSEKRVQTTRVVLMFDKSRSMTYRDGEQGKSRWEEQRALLERVVPQLQNMGAGFEFELLGFDSDLQPQDTAVTTLDTRPIGDQSDIGGALAGMLAQQVGKRLAAVILLSDGAQRARDARTSPQQVARQLDRRAVPLYTIAFGKARDQSQSRQVRIENLLDEYSVFVKNEFALRVGVRVQGYVQQPIPVTLEVIDERGQVTTVGPQQIVATEDSQTVFADFLHRPEESGQYRLRVSAKEPGAAQPTAFATSFLKVRDGGLRVLLLTSHFLHPEQKFIQWTLARSPEMELQTQYVNVLGQGQVLDLASVVDFDAYDVFLVGDLAAQAVHPDNWNEIAQRVAAGKGLLMYGGQQSFGPGGYANTALADVLPLRLSATEIQPYDPQQRPRPDRHLEGPLTIVPVSDHPTTHLAAGPGNVAAWQRLKPLLGANRLDRLKDDAEVLAATPQGDPLLVSGTFEAGRVLAVAMDSTWRWFKHGQEAAHRRFWRQSILWLARRDQREANSIFLHLPQRRVMQQGKLGFTAGLTDAQGDLVPNAALVATLELPDGTQQSVGLTNSPDGQRGLIEETAEPGIYRLRVRAPSEGPSVTEEYAEFSVEREDLELSNPAANPGLLDMLARTTERVGGKALAPEQLSTLLAEIQATPPVDEIETQSKWQLGDSSGSAWSVFLLLIVLLSLEWYLRKRWGLV